MLPKAEFPDQVSAVRQHLPDLPLIPLIETATAVLHAREVCQTDGVVRPAFGSVDLAAQMGIDHTDQQALLHARSTLVLAAASAGVARPLDGVTTAVHDQHVVAAEAAHAAQLGFTGKLCIHPEQVPTVLSAFTPGPELVRWARKVLDASGEGSVT